MGSMVLKVNLVIDFDYSLAPLALAKPNNLKPENFTYVGAILEHKTLQ
jgi:hypothetical protein